MTSDLERTLIFNNSIFCVSDVIYMEKKKKQVMKNFVCVGRRRMDDVRKGGEKAIKEN